MPVKFLIVLICSFLILAIPIYGQNGTNKVRSTLYKLEYNLTQGFPSELGPIETYLKTERDKKRSDRFYSAYYLFKASQLIANEALDSASLMLNKVDRHISEDEFLHYGIFNLLKGTVQRKRLNYSQAHDFYEQALSDFSKLTDAQHWFLQVDLEKAYFYHQQTNFVRAINHFESILEKYPQHIDAMLGMALIHNGRRDFPETLPYFTSLENLSDQMSKTQLNVFYYAKSQYFRFNNVIDSLVHYSRLSGNYDMLGWMMSEQDLYDSAKYYFHRTLKESGQLKRGTVQNMRTLVSIAYQQLYAFDTVGLNKTTSLLETEFRGHLYDDESYVCLMAAIAIDNEDYQKAFNLYKEFINYNMTYLEPQVATKIFNSLIHIYPQLSDQDEALSFHDTFIKKINKSIIRKYNYDQNMVFENLSEMNVKFLEGSRKMNEVRQKLLDEEEKAESLRIIIMWGGFGAILLISFLIYAYRSQKRIKNLNKQLEEKAKVLDVANNDKDMLLAVVSHQIKSPLANIIYFLDMSKQLLKDSNISELSKYLSSLSSSVDSSYKRAIDVLGWLNITHKDKEIMEEVSIKSLIDETLEFYRPTVEKRSLATRTDIKESKPFNINRDALKIIFQNLIENAVKYTKEGGGITITEEQSNNRRKLNIENDNDHSTIGIHDKPLGSTGMGLVIVKDLCEKFNIGLTYHNTKSTTKVVLDLA